MLEIRGRYIMFDICEGPTSDKGSLLRTKMKEITKQKYETVKRRSGEMVKWRNCAMVK